EIINLNVGGQRFSTSRSTLSWVPDTFFSSLLSGRINSTEDATGAFFIDRDPDLFRRVLHYLRTQQIDLSNVSLSMLIHEAEFYGITPLLKRLKLCQEMNETPCGDVLFMGVLDPPDEIPSVSSVKFKINDSGESSSRLSTVSSESTVDPTTRQIRTDLRRLVLRENEMDEENVNRNLMRVRLIRAYQNAVAVAYTNFGCVYKMKDSYGWKMCFVSGIMDAPIKHMAFLSKFPTQLSEKMLALGLTSNVIHLYLIEEGGDAQVHRTVGVFSLNADIDKLFFIGSQLVALSWTGKVGVWNSMTHNWQVQDVMQISSYDTAGFILLLGCTNGCIYYIDMQKFPLRMKDNDLLITELYRDPNADTITAISVYLTPKTNICGNWIEIAYGTATGNVRVIVQHPETVGHGPQLFQTHSVHTSPITRVALTTNYLISVCHENNHVRSWSVARFRGMISTQPGGQSLASFKIMTLDSSPDDSPLPEGCNPGPYGEQDGEQIFVQRVVPDANTLFILLASTGERLCTIKTVDAQPITAFYVHECEGSNRMGARPRRYLFAGTSSGSVQMFDLTTALD
ncbi:UNVERIFIED_CONTAM: BTB/POZ domain-containing protein KCTD3, partial [Eudyptes robustus]